MKTNKFIKISTLLIILFTYIGASAQQVKLSMQGILKNFNGTIVADGNYTLDFKIYTTTSGGSAIWAESQTITTDGGVYNTVLGATPQGLSDLQILPFNVPYFVGITVLGSPEITPRAELNGTAIVIRSLSATVANGVKLPGNPTVGSNALTGDIVLAGATPASDVIIQNNNLVVDTILVQNLDDHNLAGTVVPFFGNIANIPTGYLLCDGASYLRADYPYLFNRIGTASGAQSSTFFNVPDLRGKFLRGVTGAAATDPNASTRTADNAGGNTGNAVGTQQTDAQIDHTHAFSATTSSAGSHNHATASEYRDDMAVENPFLGIPGATTIWAFNIENSTTSTNTYTTNTDGAHTHTASGTTGTGTGTTTTESRPNNIYSYFIIKY
jgi:microcystin-dependent protein